MESIITSGNTHTGLRRKENQDACIIRPLRADDKALAAVIDGVGGYAGGERAAAIAKDCIEQYMLTPSGDTLTMLREAVIFANNQIVEERKKDQRLAEMCCVLTALVADTIAQQIYFVHIGDTRLYRYRNDKLQKLTRDHSFVGIREDAGEISEKEAMAHPHRNQILREAGSALHRLDDEDFMDYGQDEFLPGDLLLLCSDGLTDMITAQQMTGILSASQPLENKTNQLIALANECGGHDNITVVLLQYPVIAKNTEPMPAVSKDAASLPVQAINKKNRQWGKTTLVSALLFLILFAGAGWYFIAPGHVRVPATSHLIPTPAEDSIQQDSNHAKPLGRASHTAVEGPLVLEKTDTLRISSTRDFADIKKYTDSSGNLLVLLPEKKSGNHFAAVSITGRSAKPGDTLLIRNLRLTGFETGIDIHLPVFLQAENIAFENTIHPVRYLLKPNEKKASILFMNTVKQ